MYISVGDIHLFNLVYRQFNNAVIGELSGADCEYRSSRFYTVNTKKIVYINYKPVRLETIFY